MTQPPIYTYHYRPGYGSGNMLIEFVSGVETQAFGADLFDAIQEINPRLVEQQDIWMNDEMICTIHTDCGPITLSKDIWQLAFLMSDDHQHCISVINSLLLQDKRFQKIEEDPRRL